MVYVIWYLTFLAKSKWLNKKLSNQNLVLDAQSLHKAQWYSNRSYIFFFRFFSSSAITDVGWRNNGYCKFHNTITGKNFKFYMLLFNSICHYDRAISCNRSINNNFLVLEFQFRLGILVYLSSQGPLITDGRNSNKMFIFQKDIR